MKDLKKMKKKKHTRKGIALGELVTIALMFVLIGVTLGIGAYINTQIGTTAGFTAGSASDTVIKNSTIGLANIGAWLPIIGIVIAAGVIIGVLVRSFSMNKGGV